MRWAEGARAGGWGPGAAGRPGAGATGGATKGRQVLKARWLEEGRVAGWRVCHGGKEEQQSAEHYCIVTPRPSAEHFNQEVAPRPSAEHYRLGA